MPKRATKKSLSKEALAYYMLRPVEFCQDFILRLSPEEVRANVPGRRLEPESKAIMTAVAIHEYTTIPAGRGVTKTFSLAMIIIWFIYTRNHAKVAITGPKYESLFDTLWQEVKKWLLVSALNDELEWNTERLTHTNPKITSFARILTAKDKENLAGYHDEHVLWVVDEASNVPKPLIEQILGGLTDPEIRMVMAGNPTRADGYFYESFTVLAGTPWFVLRLSSENCARKSAVWFAQMKRYPPDSDMYRVNVLGLPPHGNPKAIITLSQVLAARDRELMPAEPWFELGVDPASEGTDLLAICIRQGNKVWEIKTWAKSQAPEICGHVISTVIEYRAKLRYQGKVRVKIDDTGYGQAIRQFLATDTANNLDIIPCHYQGSGTDQFVDNGTVMWYTVAQAIDEISIPNDDLLIEELAGREFVYSGGKIKLEDKKKFKERLGRSPDRADALMLAFAGGKPKIFQRREDSEPVGKSFSVDWNCTEIFNQAFVGVHMSDVIHCVAMCMAPDLSVSVLFTIYEQIVDRMWVYADLRVQMPVPELIIPQVKAISKYGFYPEDTRHPRVIGNDAMFSASNGVRPMSDVMREKGMPVWKPTRYDKFGAIGLGAHLFYKNLLKVHNENARSALIEVNLWSIDKDSPDETAFFCQALLLALSETRMFRRLPPATEAAKDYRPVMEQAPLEIKNQQQGNSTAWMTN